MNINVPIVPSPPPQEQFAELEGGDRAFAFTSGMAALAAVCKLVKTGEHIVAGEDIYGGTSRLLMQVRPCVRVCTWTGTGAGGKLGVCGVGDGGVSTLRSQLRGRVADRCVRRRTRSGRRAREPSAGVGVCGGRWWRSVLCVSRLECGLHLASALRHGDCARTRNRRWSPTPACPSPTWT